MYITNISDDYNGTLSKINNCTNKDNNIDIIIPLLTIIPSGMSLICFISLMVYTLVKDLFNKNNRWIITNIRVLIPGYNYTYSSTYLSNINGDVSLSNSSS